MAVPLSVEEFKKMVEDITPDPDARHEVIRPSVEEIKAALRIYISTDYGPDHESDIVEVKLMWNDEVISSDFL